METDKIKKIIKMNPNGGNNKKSSPVKKFSIGVFHRLATASSF